MYRQPLVVTSLSVAVQFVIRYTNIVYLQRGKLNYMTNHSNADLHHVANRGLSYVYSTNTNKTIISGTVR